MSWAKNIYMARNNVIRLQLKNSKFYKATEVIIIAKIR